jgi:phage gp36-like protein
MSYCTQADITNSGLSSAELVRLSDDNGDGVADPAVVAKAIADADAEIDGYLGARYTIPVAPVPALLTKLAAAIAAWNLYGHRGLANERRQKDYEEAIATLRRLARGEMVLPDATSGAVATDGGGAAQSSRTAADRIATIGRSSTGEVGTLDGY